MNPAMKWALVKKYHELTGKTEKAFNRMREDGKIAEGLHWKKGPDGRIWVNLEEMDRWVDVA